MPYHHVDYILVAEFDIDQGPTISQQYPHTIGSDTKLLAELMLPDQAHMRSEDWTIFFLHRDTNTLKKNHNDLHEVLENQENSEPKLMYVLNLVNTKHDPDAKRGALVKAMAICTRHSFLHIYKPILLLALKKYLEHPKKTTLEHIFNSVNSMDLKMMPKLNFWERIILGNNDYKTIYHEKFPNTNTKESIQDCHEYETSIVYLGVQIPVKIPLDILPEAVGDFSLINLFQAFPQLPTKSFPLHAHLTTIGSHTHPIIVLMNALLTQKRIVFLGHGQSAGDVAKYVLASSAMASGLGVLRGFLERTFPYTDLSKIDYLLTISGYIAGVTNPTFERHPEWWDILCDIDTGKIKISSCISPANIPSYLGDFFCDYANEYQRNDMDTIFIDEMKNIISCKYGEYSVRSKWRDWVLRFTKMASTYETLVYGFSRLSNPNAKNFIIPGTGWVWQNEAQKMRDLYLNMPRFEGWRNTTSYEYYIEDLIVFNNIPIEKKFCLQHQLNRLKILRNISYEDAEAIYITLNDNVRTIDELSQLLCYLPRLQGGLTPIAAGLFHPNPKVQFAVAELLERLDSHIAGRHFINDLNKFQKLAFSRILSKKSKLRKN
ncbi:hypothetical protein PNEG_03307 [Pneumocystis murina B123]|uniref:UDENN domain-containing protein n=1 Tax=Pneumocystis murina (strain B123) TaxID=1069680 RepID=M7P3P9_PNEMU|nr:hypothetical protein PNEG_03307 [Pneumocystis murina B123]EMR08480.1 hypothetical protein PNEG_03307 [Pneumocystis murina B123]